MTLLPRYMVSDVLDWYDRQDKRKLTAAAAVTVVALWCIGIAVVGESELHNEQPAQYEHPEVTP